MKKKEKLDKYEKTIDALVIAQGKIKEAYQYLDELNIHSFSVALISLGFNGLVQDIGKYLKEEENGKELLEKIIEKLKAEGVE